MGIQFTVDGTPLNATEFSFQAGVVSHRPSDTSVGVGGLSVSAPLHQTTLGDEWATLEGTTLVANDNDTVAPRTFEFAVSGGSLSDNDSLTLESEGSLFPTLRTTTVKPFRGTVTQCITHILNSVGASITPTFGTTLTSNNPIVDLPAYHGVVWNFFRDFMSAHRIDFTVTSRSTVQFERWFSRPDYLGIDRELMRTRTAGVTVSSTNVAEEVELTWNETKYGTNLLAYPVSSEEPTIISVRPGEVAVVELTTPFGFDTVNNPVAVDWLDRFSVFDGTMGAYTVCGDDGKGLKASAWVAGGGSVTATVKEDDPYTVIVTVRPPNVGILANIEGQESIAPYHIAMTDTELYPTLFLTGTGTRVKQHTMRAHTGAVGHNVQTGVGATLENPAVTTQSLARDMMLRLAQEYGGVTTTLNRTIAERPSLNNSKFLGAVVATDLNNYRVESVSMTPSGADVQASPYLRMSDFDASWGTGTTMQAFDTYLTANRSRTRIQDISIFPKKAEVN